MPPPLTLSLSGRMRPSAPATLVPSRSAISRSARRTWPSSAAWAVTLCVMLRLSCSRRVAAERSSPASRSRAATVRCAAAACFSWATASASIRWPWSAAAAALPTAASRTSFMTIACWVWCCVMVAIVSRAVVTCTSRTSCSSDTSLLCSSLMTRSRSVSRARASWSASRCASSASLLRRTSSRSPCATCSLFSAAAAAAAARALASASLDLISTCLSWSERFSSMMPVASTTLACTCWWVAPMVSTTPCSRSSSMARRSAAVGSSPSTCTPASATSGGTGTSQRTSSAAVTSRSIMVWMSPISSMYADGSRRCAGRGARHRSWLRAPPLSVDVWEVMASPSCRARSCRISRCSSSLLAPYTRSPRRTFRSRSSSNSCGPAPRMHSSVHSTSMILSASFMSFCSSLKRFSCALALHSSSSASSRFLALRSDCSCAAWLSCRGTLASSSQAWFIHLTAAAVAMRHAVTGSGSAVSPRQALPLKYTTRRNGAPTGGATIARTTPLVPIRGVSPRRTEVAVIVCATANLVSASGRSGCRLSQSELRVRIPSR
mmetsp:Transcript_11319/g.29003  ORF Transcript_11319/g.29003 Transcript_11319/m.29003 type:complete len:549 (+) Transcript_11319:839-2485(+)